MRDCDNVTMRDLLPDLLHDRLAAGVRAEVHSHVDGCADCRAELEVLRAVVGGVVAPRVDASRISTGLRPYRRPSALARAARSWPMRAAAAVILLAGTAVALRQDDPTTGMPDSVLASASSPDLAVGALADITDQDLRALADELAKLQAVTPTEPEVVVPGVGRGSE